MSSEGYHEREDQLSDKVKDHHRAISSLMEELEAVDWYDQRVEAAADPELAEILAHNRDEEKEHAAMVLEWLRRRDAYLDDMLRTYLFTDKPVTEIEEEDTEGGAEEGVPQAGGLPKDGGLGIGSLRGAPQNDQGEK